MKYPIGIQDFKCIIEEGYVYIDKTALIYDMVHDGKIYFLSRPRRFGKSLLVSTLENYFSGRKELFKGLAIESLETEWETYPVFHIDFNSDDFSNENILSATLDSYVPRPWEKANQASILLGRAYKKHSEISHNIIMLWDARCAG